MAIWTEKVGRQEIQEEEKGTIYETLKSAPMNISNGFKSYRDQIVVEPFDRGLNVVVGRNGSGKSNFFYAIQFVLSDEFVHLRSEQRQALLHEGIGPRVISAYVEIIFDNSDNRVPIDQDEIFLRRVIGAKKDQYFLNKKAVPRSEVMNLLESAGFSSSNPYYIVKQGKINELATASDSSRLKLLKEIAGIRVYDERRNESVAILRVNEGQMEKIEELLRTIEERLHTLEEEKEELKQYQHNDKMRRALDYILHEVELSDNKKKLLDLDIQRNHSVIERKKLADNLKKAQDQIETISKNLKDTKKELALYKQERDILNNDLQNLIKEKAKLDLTIKDLSEEVQGENKSKKSAEKELKHLENSIKEKEAELEKIKPQYEAMKKKEEECMIQLTMKEQKRKELYAKQSRGSLFTSKAGRNRWIEKELNSLQKHLKNKKDHLQKLDEDLKRDAAKVVDLNKKIKDKTGELERQRVYLDENNKVCFELNKTKNLHQSKRNELSRKEYNIQQNLLSLKEDLARANVTLYSMVGKPILNGCDSIKKVLDTFVARGGHEAEIAKLYYGPVIENFNCDKSLYTALEVTTGNKLFHHIVESDIVGAQILKEMNRQKLPGAVTFMPLNRLNVWSTTYPQDRDATPMISKLLYDQKFDKAIRFLFGTSLICRNLEVASKYAKPCKLNCVTLDGDSVSYRGTFTGGYYNKSQSRFEMQKARTEYIEQIKQCEEELRGLKEEMLTIESQINNVISEMQKTEMKNSKAKGIFDKVKGDLRLMKEELASIERFREPKEQSLQQCHLNLQAMISTIQGLESELQLELSSQLSDADKAQVNSLNDEIQRLQCENKETFSMRMKLEGEKNKLDNLLTNNLIKKKDELINALQNISLEDRKRQLTNCEVELEEIDKKVKKVNSDLISVDVKIEEMSKKLKNEENELDKYNKIEKEAQDIIDEDAKHLEKLANKQHLLQLVIEESEKKIEKLGPLPSGDLLSQYKNMSSKSLFKALKKANDHLRRYSHVNKKALEQFTSFSNQKEKLRKEKKELDTGLEKIKELMEIQEQRKMEAIQFTYKQISKYFSEVFKKLVPVGKGKLVMKRIDNDEGQEIGPQDTNTDVYTGIGIKVSFTESDAEMREMTQLSGGQKSLVALALIFAIQKCNPAPFYLFDEIDQALDAQHRKVVANMIHELSDKAQFIITTFRPELLEHGNKFYGVKFRNKVSHVECVTKEVAKDFVEDDQTHA